MKFLYYSPSTAFQAVWKFQDKPLWDSVDGLELEGSSGVFRLQYGMIIALSRNWSRDTSTSAQHNNISTISRKGRERGALPFLESINHSGSAKLKHCHYNDQIKQHQNHKYSTKRQKKRSTSVLIATHKWEERYWYHSLDSRWTWIISLLLVEDIILHQQFIYLYFSRGTPTKNSPKDVLKLIFLKEFLMVNRTYLNKSQKFD